MQNLVQKNVAHAQALNAAIAERRAKTEGSEMVFDQSRANSKDVINRPGKKVRDACELINKKETDKKLASECAAIATEKQQNGVYARKAANREAVSSSSEQWEPNDLGKADIKQLRLCRENLRPVKERSTESVRQASDENSTDVNINTGSTEQSLSGIDRNRIENFLEGQSEDGGVALSAQQNSDTSSPDVDANTGSTEQSLAEIDRIRTEKFLKGRREDGDFDFQEYQKYMERQREGGDVDLAAQQDSDANSPDVNINTGSTEQSFSEPDLDRCIEIFMEQRREDEDTKLQEAKSNQTWGEYITTKWSAFLSWFR